MNNKSSSIKKGSETSCAETEEAIQDTKKVTPTKLYVKRKSVSNSPTGTTPQRNKQKHSESPITEVWADAVDLEEVEAVKTQLVMTEEKGRTNGAGCGAKDAQKPMTNDDLASLIGGLKAGIDSMKEEMKKELEDGRRDQKKMYEELTKRMGGLEIHAGKQDAEIDELKKWRKEKEAWDRREIIRKSKRGLIIFGLKEAEGGRERIMTTIKKLRDDMKADEDCLSGAEAWRLRRSANDARKDNKPRPVMVRFGNLMQKMDFMAGARNLEKDSKLVFKHDVPVFMMGDVNKLEKKCIEMRKSTGGKTKTRLRWKADKLVAQIKKEGEDTFKDMGTD